MTEITSPKVGEIFSHYKIQKKIGAGGMGIVFMAEDIQLKRNVALKFLVPELTRNAEATERFLREAQAAAALDHPNICTIFEIKTVKEQTFISMAYLDGSSLKEVIESGPLGIDRTLDIVGKITEGIKAAHDAGIIHRDIKPANIMISEIGTVTITDFGLAKLEWQNDLTKTSTVMGTPAYMSPEQASGKKVDFRTDIWSLGCVLYEMLSGRKPFLRENYQAVLFALLNESPVPLIEFRNDIPKALEHLMQRCLQKNPEDRPSDMNQILMELKSIKADHSANDKQNTMGEKDKSSSIAVLPFVNMSADPENEYFSDGLTEELINALTKIRDLKVVARTSSFAFKGEKADLRDVGKKLNVSHLLEGSVRKSGNRIRITAQLIDVSNGFHLWSERYDRELEDVFVIQDEITERIANRLKKDMPSSDKVEKISHTDKLEAYDLYLKGRYHSNKNNIDKAMVYYEQALEKDPEYSLAHAAVAEAYITLSIGFDILPSRDAMPKAKKAAETALKLDPGLAEVYVSLGMIATFQEWDREGAKRYFEKAVALNPNLANAYMWSEFYMTFLEGDFDRAMSAVKKAQDLDPLNILIKVRLGYMYIYTRDFDRAVEVFKEIIDLEPQIPFGHHCLMDALGQKNLYHDAIAAGEKMRELGGEAVAHVGALGYYYGLDGQTEKAQAILDDLLERSRKGYVSSLWVATVYLGLGDIDKVFEWLDRAFEERDANLIYITIPPQMDRLRSDKRFAALLKKMGLWHLLKKKPWEVTKRTQPPQDSDKTEPML